MFSHSISTQTVDLILSSPSNRSRRSAVRARKSLSAMNPRANPANMLEQMNKAIQTIKRHRKQRHARLREMTRDDEEGTTKVRDTWASGGGEIVCPVCLQTVRGDEDVREAHVDACLAHESRRLEEERERDVHHDLSEGVDGDGEPGIRIGNVSGARGETFCFGGRDMDLKYDQERGFTYAIAMNKM
jgi:hypothetical protein